MTLTRRYRFSASHRLHSPRLSEEENRELYGRCNNAYGHGHNYIVEVSVAGTVDRDSGRVVDVTALDQLVGERVLAALDQRNLNVDVPEFDAIVPTTENLTAAIQQRLQAHWPGAFPKGLPSLDRVRVIETRNNFFETRP